MDSIGDIIWRLDLDKIDEMNVGKIIKDKIQEINKLHGIESRTGSKKEKKKEEKREREDKTEQTV